MDWAACFFFPDEGAEGCKELIYFPLILSDPPGKVGLHGAAAMTVRIWVFRSIAEDLCFILQMEGKKSCDAEMRTEKKSIRKQTTHDLIYCNFCSLPNSWLRGVRFLFGCEYKGLLQKFLK